MRKATLLALLLPLSAALAQPAPPPGPALQLQVDASAAPRRFLTIRESVPVQAGPLSLIYPKWLPGEHGPTGPINSVVNLQVNAVGKDGALTRLAWKRDPLEMYRIATEVPAGCSQLQLDFAFVGGFASERLGVVSFNEVVWFPEGKSAADTPVTASVTLPPGWKGVSALTRTPATGSLAQPTVDLATLVDSPLLFGRDMADLTLSSRAVGTSPARPHALHIVAERPEALKIPDGLQQHLSNLVEQAGVLFGGRHYDHYDWLLSLSDVPRQFGGLEHHQCSDNIMTEDTLSDPALTRNLNELLAHEFTHSWCGKYRRPAGLLSPDYMKPMDGSLLWVYEGLTTFWGEILPVRAGAISPERFRETLAAIAGSYAVQGGKKWRSLADTAVAAQLLYESPNSWRALRRGTDFYAESVLLWLEVDARLREGSGGKKSLDDFCHAFFGPPSQGAEVKPYTEDELYAALNAVVAAPWKSILRTRLDATDGAAFADALTRSGWKLVYSDKVNDSVKESDARGKGTSRMFSLGASLDANGSVRDVEEFGPAARAGLAPGMTLVAVNGHKYTSKILDEALGAKGTPLKLMVENGSYYRELSVDWKEGGHYPHLERLADTPDRLSLLLKPRQVQ